MEVVPSCLSLQVGSKANFIGTYLWQIRDNEIAAHGCASCRLQQYYHTVGQNHFPKTVMLDHDRLGHAFGSDNAVDKQDVLWGGSSSIVQRLSSDSR
jgi:hypothetical protein